MTADRPRRYAVAGLCVVTFGVAVFVAAEVSVLWGAAVVPFALLFGAGAWKGLSLAESWEAAGPGDGDPGTGPAGMSQ
jgi:hypothetical protein